MASQTPVQAHWGIFDPDEGLTTWITRNVLRFARMAFQGADMGSQDLNDCNPGCRYVGSLVSGRTTVGYPE